MKTGIKVGKNVPYVLNLCVHDDKKKNNTPYSSRK